MDGSACIARVRGSIYLGAGEFRRWLFDGLWQGDKGRREWRGLATYPRVGHERNGIAGPRETIKVAEFCLDRLEGEKQRTVKVLREVV